MGFATGLTGLYLFENNGNDSFGSNTLVAGGTPAFGASPTPQEGSYQVGPLDNTNYYTVPAGVLTPMTSAGRVEFYAQTPSVSAYGSCFTITNTAWASAGRYLIFRLDGSDSKFRLQYTKPTDTSIASTGTWAINTWYHIAIAWTAGTIKMYVDNSEVATAADTLDLGTPTGARWGWHVVAGSNASVYVDEAAFYSAYSTGPFPTDHVFSSGSAQPTWFMRRRRGR